jgi:putrescine transport system substrate-binding protein
MRDFFCFSKHVIAILALTMLSCPSRAEEQLNIYSWAGYISEAALAQFTKETGIAVNYDTFDSLETLETKMLTGKTGYDVVFPAGPVLERLIKLNLVLPLDGKLIPNRSGLDPVILNKLSVYDPGNKYGAPYMWGTVGVGYNIDAVRQRLPDDPLDSLSLVFDPEKAAKVADCGIGILDSPAEVLAITLNYLGFAPDSGDAGEINKARDLIMGVRKYIRNIRNDNTIDALASGEVCVQLGYGGDVFSAISAAKEGNTGANIAFFVPKEGTIVFFDSMSIPADAPHVTAAHKFIDYMLRPDVMAENSNLAHAANAVVASKPLMNPDIASNPALYPPTEIMAKLLADKTVTPETARLRTRAWADIRAGE